MCLADEGDSDIALQEDPLAQYRVTYRSDGHTLKDVGDAQLVPVLPTPAARYRSPQLVLWDPDAVEWHNVLKVPPYARRRRAASSSEWEQQALLM